MTVWPTLPSPDTARRASGFRVQPNTGAGKGPLGVSVIRAEVREPSTLRARVDGNASLPGQVRVSIDSASSLVTQRIEVPPWGVAIPVSAGFVELSVDGSAAALEATVSPGLPVLRPEPRASYGAAIYAPAAAIVPQIGVGPATADAIPDWAVRARLKLLSGAATVLSYAMVPGDTVDVLPSLVFLGTAGAGGAVILWSWEVVW